MLDLCNESGLLKVLADGREAKRRGECNRPKKDRAGVHESLIASGQRFGCNFTVFLFYILAGTGILPVRANSSADAEAGQDKTVQNIPP